jgi:acyl-CoA thioester hydrolase
MPLGSSTVTGVTAISRGLIRVTSRDKDDVTEAGRAGVGSTPLHLSSFRVAMADTDAARVIYFGAPLRWSERLVTTWLADADCGTWQMLNDGHGLPAVHCEVDYASALRLDDVVSASLWMDRWTRRSVTFRSEFRLDDAPEPSVVVRVTQVGVETHPDALRSVELMPKLVAALEMSSRAATTESQRGKDE